MQAQADTGQTCLSGCQCRFNSAASEALMRMGGNVRLFFRLVRLLEEVITARVGEIRAAIARGDSRAVAFSAHSLHGAALTVGAVGVAALAHGLELAADKGDLAGLAGQVDELERHGREFICLVSDPAWLQSAIADVQVPISGPSSAENAAGSGNVGQCSR